jgi:predicted nucleic acid-binding protein
MPAKVFVDVNIVIDLIEKRDFELDYVVRIFKAAEQKEIQLFVSESVITNTLYITGLSKQLLLVLEIAQLICISTNTIKKALQSDFKDKEDAILYYGALENKMDYFISRNKKDFAKYSNSNLPVYSAKEFCMLMQSNI